MRNTFVAAVLGALVGSAVAAEVKLPSQVVWTAYGTGSAGYNQSVAIGAALQEALGINLRVLPGKNDIARTEPVRQGKVQFSANGVGGSFMAQEGVFQFGAENWGPQPVRVLAANNGGAVGLALAVALGKENLEALISQEFGHMRRLDGMSTNKEERFSDRSALATGPELIAHICAGTLPNPALSSMVSGLLVGSSQFIKCSRGASFIPRAFAPVEVLVGRVVPAAAHRERVTGL